jgi:hypothetical protein
MLTLEQLEATEALTPQLMKDNLLRIWSENSNTSIGTIDPKILLRIHTLIARYRKNKKRNWPTPSNLLQFANILHNPTVGDIHNAFYMQKALFPKTKIIVINENGAKETFKTPEELIKYLTL